MTRLVNADIFGDLQAFVTKVLQPDELAASFQAAGPETETQLHAALVRCQAHHSIVSLASQRAPSCCACFLEVLCTASAALV